MFWENSESVPHALRGRTFLAVLSHLKTLDLPDYCPIISRIKFWWISFFFKPKTDLWKPRYHLIMKATLSPKSWWAEEEHLTFCIRIFSWLCIWYFCICVCVHLSLCLSFCLFLYFSLFAGEPPAVGGGGGRESGIFWTKLENLV